MIERHYMALFRSKAPHCHRRQELIEATFYKPVTAIQIANALIYCACAKFRCDYKTLIIDKVIV